MKLWNAYNDKKPDNTIIVIKKNYMDIASLLPDIPLKALVKRFITQGYSEFTELNLNIFIFLEIFIGITPFLQEFWQIVKIGVSI